MILICRTTAPETGHDGCGYAVLAVTGDLLVTIAERKAVAAKLNEDAPGFYTLSCWDYSLDFLDDVPEDWEEWLEENAKYSGEWAELPFPYDRDSATDELDGEFIKLGRTECDQMYVTGTEVFWTAIIKHTSCRIETPYFPELPLLEQLALTKTTQVDQDNTGTPNAESL